MARSLRWREGDSFPAFCAKRIKKISSGARVVIRNHDDLEPILPLHDLHHTTEWPERQLWRGRIPVGVCAMERPPGSSANENDKWDHGRRPTQNSTDHKRGKAEEETHAENPLPHEIAPHSVLSRAKPRTTFRATAVA